MGAGTANICFSVSPDLSIIEVFCLKKTPLLTPD